MCGLLGVFVPDGTDPGLSLDGLGRLRDRLAHRGPDSSGTWACPHAFLAHRRLVVVDPSPGAGQPFMDPHDWGVLVYNGELYNDAELRRDLAARGVRFRTASDTETVLAALLEWGEAALERFRGMFALAFYDRRTRGLLLARDPLGIKPLYWTGWREGVAFASEISPLLELPGREARPDLHAVSSYLTTIRTTLGTRTLYHGVRTLLPGGVLRVSAGGSCREIHARPRPGPREGVSLHDVIEGTRAVVVDSITRHLRTDVPMCSLLSGGLDSTIIASVAGRTCGTLRTYSAAAADARDGGDAQHAALAATSLGTDHTHVAITREEFLESWRDLVGAQGVPLSTPNEVAIHAVARALRARGDVVALSGEGADELFGGYDSAMRSAEGYARAGGVRGGEHELDQAAWVPREAKAAILRDEVWHGVERDAAMHAWHDSVFDECYEDAGAWMDPLERRVQAHLMTQRRLNLSGLLLRLDSATMRAGVEGRTPLADVGVLRWADSLPMRWKFDGVETKIALRRAFADDVPPAVLRRPKASFPLPFEAWIADAGEWLRGSDLAREVFTEAAVETVGRSASALWRLAWPMCNIALWGERLSRRPRASHAG